MTTRVYRQGQELPDFAVEWKDSSGNIIDFSSGYTFTFSLFDRGYTHVYQQTSGITGSSASPNVSVAFPADAFDSVDPGAYGVLLRARRTSDSKDRDWPPGGTDSVTIQIEQAVT